MSPRLLAKSLMFAEPAMGRVEQPITAERAGRVSALGSIWFARLLQPETPALAIGDRVMVVGREGITLLVVSEADFLYGLS